MKSILLGALALALIVPAAAQAREESVAVRTGDLSLSRQADAQRLLRRLDRAALDVCGASISSVREVQAAIRASDCYAQAMDQAVAQVGSPAVSDLYRQRGQAYAAR
ncbi:UrcA family protein [Phenylobacterium sp.]|uniref:UrcA family protein n=1 Tax=Phenylobacterium sp. TaxID=1871053 RepID=UPI0035B254E9